MPGLLPNVDPEGLLEFSVVYTDRAVNHMSAKFQSTMKDISATLKQAYKAHSVAVVPGSGSFGMEAVARQFASGKKALVVRNGWFSYRWSQILETGSIASSHTVLKARRASPSDDSCPFAPPPISEVVAAIAKEKPDVVFAPHVETSAGIMIPDNYIKELAAAAHAVGALFVLDCIASGCMWVDMEHTGVDVLISAPQKGWSGPPCCAFVLLSQLARTRIDSTTSTSFCCDLKKWLQIMETYEKGSHMYHATMPTDALVQVRAALFATRDFGFEKAKSAQNELGQRVRKMLESKGIISVAAAGFQAPSVVVSYTTNPDIKTGKAFADIGVQIAAGVPLQVDEGPAYSSFRIGLFGLDKISNIDATLSNITGAVSKAVAIPKAPAAPSAPVSSLRLALGFGVVVAVIARAMTKK